MSIYADHSYHAVDFRVVAIPGSIDICKEADRMVARTSLAHDGAFGKESVNPEFLIGGYVVQFRECC